MSGGAKFEYLWQDGTKYKKPTHLPAPQYISLLMDWVESQINDEMVGGGVGSQTMFIIINCIPAVSCDNGHSFP